MKNWFLNLSSKQRKNVYVISIIVSFVMFYAIILTPIFIPLWAGALAAVILERKIIKEQNQKEGQKIDENMEQVATSEKRVGGEYVAPSIPSAINEEMVKIVEIGGGLSYIDFGKPIGELGCFLNYEPHNLRLPTENQLEKLKSYGVDIPDGITVEDAQRMINRLELNHEPPRSELIALALGLNIKFSAFASDSRVFNSIVYDASKRDRFALYAYAVRQSMRGDSFGNMLADPDVALFYAFADKAITDPALIRSLENRTSDDYIKPYKGTAIYKAAAAHLTGGK